MLELAGLPAQPKLHAAGQSLVRVDTDAGFYGVGEAGVAGPAARANLLWLERVLIGADPLNIDKLYQQMMGLQHTFQAHVPTISGTDRAAVEDWAARFRAHPHGYRTVKLDFAHLLNDKLLNIPFAAAVPSQTLKASDFAVVQTAYDLFREVIGREYDFIVHCHNEWDVPSAIGLCQAVESSRPIWIEDPLQVWFNDGYKALRAASNVPICTGEKVEGFRDFMPFITEGGIDVLHPDLCWCGGISGGRKIAELADHYGLPVALHNCGSLVHNMANIHFGASVRNFSMSETRLYAHDFIAEMGGLDGFDVVDGKIAVPDGPGLGIELVDEVLRRELKEGEPYWE